MISSKETVRGIEYEMTGKDGSPISASTTLAPLVSAEGRITEVVGITRDITDRKQAEDALRDSQQRMELALQGAELGTWDTALPSGVKTYDKRYAEMLGYTLDELAAMDRFERELHPDDELRASEAWDTHANGTADSYEVEYRIRHKLGHFVWVLCNGRIVKYDDDGTPLHASGTHLDISMRKQAEEEKDRLLSELRDALDQVRRLGGLLPICSYCKKVRDDKGYYHQIESYIRDHSEADFSHGICPDCADEHFPDMDLYGAEG